MTTAERTYRGVNYSPNQHERVSSTFVEHVYRGKRYEAPLKHEPTAPNQNVELNYRGTVYNHRQKAASLDTKN